MLNASAMKDLLSANVDENASHFACVHETPDLLTNPNPQNRKNETNLTPSFFSRYGTIMGHDHAADVKAVKRFAAFAANTWAHNVISIHETGRTITPLTPGTSILQAVIREDGNGLHCLVVQVGELVGAVTHVREGTLLAALKGKGEFSGEEDEIAERIKGVEVGMGFGRAERKESAEAKADGVEKGDDGSDSEGSTAEDGGKGKGKGKEREGEDGKATKMQILVWRSEGMGQYMADELGAKFKIPKGFY